MSNCMLYNTYTYACYKYVLYILENHSNAHNTSNYYCKQQNCSQ